MTGPQTLTIDPVPLATSSFTVAATHTRHIQATFKVTNNTGQTQTNLAFLPAATFDSDGDPSNNAQPPTVAGTPFSKVLFYDGSDASAKATALHAAPGQIFNVSTGLAQTDPLASHFLTNVDLSSVSAIPPTGLTVTVKNYGWQVSSSLAPGASANVTFAVDLPNIDLNNPKADPYNITLVFTSAAEGPGANATNLERVTQAAAASGVTNLATTTNAANGLDVTGTLNGVPFAARFPAVWNKKSVIFAHGYVRPGTAEPAQDPNTDPSLGLLPAATSQGYAVAYSAFAKTGYAVKEGIAASKALHDFLDRAGSVQDYATGLSMGGNIAQALTELYPNEYAGALPYCGVVAGWRSEQRYVVDFRLIYDYYTKNTKYALPGAGDSQTPNPAYTDATVQASVVSLFQDANLANDLTAQAIIAQVASVAGTPADPTSFAIPLATFGSGLQDQQATAGGNGYGNTGKVYSGNDGLLNAGIERISSTAAASSYLDANFKPSGNFRTKTLSVHNLSDPLVPFSQEAEFKNVVGGAGNTANLAQQVVDAKPVDFFAGANTGPQHCYFTPSQLTYAWNELTAWVNGGAKPTEGQNITAN